MFAWPSMHNVIT